MTNRIKAWLRTRAGRLVIHDATVALATGAAAWDAAGHSLTWGAAVAAGVVAGKAFLRLLLPVPGAGRHDAEQQQPTTFVPSWVTTPANTAGSQYTVVLPGWQPYLRPLALLPKETGPKLGHLPSPRDDRDLRYRPDKAKASLTVHNAAGLTFDALGNLSIGDCAEAGEEHARQVIAHINGQTYTPTTAETVGMYSQITGYRPGDPSTDNGTVLRQMLSDLHRQGIIIEYRAVPADVTSLRSAVATHGAVIAGFALPAGAETEGVKWRVPRSGKAAGSWGGHCVPLVGSTSELFDLVSWGEVGTVSHGFVNDYIDEAWVVTYADTALSN